MDGSEKTPPISKSVMHKVTETKALIEKHYYRIDVIQKVLAKKAMEEKEREKLESELDTLKQVLEESEVALQHLHDANRETTKMAFLLTFTILSGYCISSVFVNENLFDNCWLF